jgi:hypothetical protein
VEALRSGGSAENVADFEKIKNFCDIRIIRSAEYFNIFRPR